MSRQLNETLDIVMSLVPASFPDRETIGDIFADIKDSTHYLAPESLAMFWGAASLALEDILGPPDDEWKVAIQQEMTQPEVVAEVPLEE